MTRMVKTNDQSSVALKLQGFILECLSVNLRPLSRYAHKAGRRNTCQAYLCPNSLGNNRALCNLQNGRTSVSKNLFDWIFAQDEVNFLFRVDTVKEAIDLSADLVIAVNHKFSQKDGCWEGRVLLSQLWIHGLPKQCNSLCKGPIYLIACETVLFSMYCSHYDRWWKAAWKFSWRKAIPRIFQLSSVKTLLPCSNFMLCAR